MRSGNCASVYDCLVPAIAGSSAGGSGQGGGSSGAGGVVSADCAHASGSSGGSTVSMPVKVPRRLVKKDMHLPARYSTEKLCTRVRHLLGPGEKALRVLRDTRAIVQLYGVAVHWEEGVPSKVLQFLEYGGKDLRRIQERFLEIKVHSGITWVVHPGVGAGSAMTPMEYSFVWGKEGFDFGGVQLVGYSVTRCLAAMHTNGIYCCDAKPENCLFRNHDLTQQQLRGQNPPQGQKQRRKTIHQMGVSDECIYG